MIHPRSKLPIATFSLSTPQDREAAWHAWKKGLEGGRPLCTPSTAEDTLLCAYSELRLLLNDLKRLGAYKEERVWCERGWKEIMRYMHEEGVPLDAKWVLNTSATSTHEKNWYRRLGRPFHYGEKDVPTLLVLMLRTGSREALQEAVRALFSTLPPSQVHTCAVTLWRCCLQGGGRKQIETLAPLLLPFLSPEKLWEEWLSEITHERGYNAPAFLGAKAWKNLCRLTGYEHHPPPCFLQPVAHKSIAFLIKNPCTARVGAHLTHALTQWPTIIPSWIQAGKDILTVMARREHKPEEEVKRAGMKAYRLAFKLGFWSGTDLWSSFLKDLKEELRQEITCYAWSDADWNPAIEALDNFSGADILKGSRRVDKHATLLARTLGPPALPHGLLCTLLKKAVLHDATPTSSSFPSSAWWRAHNGPGYTMASSMSHEECPHEHPLQWALSKNVLDYLYAIGIEWPVSGPTFARWCTALAGTLLRVKSDPLQYAHQKAFLTEGLLAPWGNLDEALPGLPSPRHLAHLHGIPLPSEQSTSLSSKKARSSPSLVELIQTGSWGAVSKRINRHMLWSVNTSTSALHAFFKEDAHHGSALTTLLLSASHGLLALDALPDSRLFRKKQIVTRYTWPPKTRGGKAFLALLHQACHAHIFSEIRPDIRQECLKSLRQLSPVTSLSTWSQEETLRDEGRQLFSGTSYEAPYWNLLLNAGPQVWGTDADEVWGLLMHHVPHETLGACLKWIKEADGEKRKAACHAWFDTPERTNAAFKRLARLPPDLDQGAEFDLDLPLSSSLFVEAFLRYGKKKPGVHPASFWRNVANAYFDEPMTPPPFTHLLSWYGGVEARGALEDVLDASSPPRRHRL